MMDVIEHRYVRKLQSFWMHILLSFVNAIECSAAGQSTSISIDGMGKVEKEEGDEHHIIAVESP